MNATLKVTVTSRPAVTELVAVIRMAPAASVDPVARLIVVLAALFVSVGCAVVADFNPPPAVTVSDPAPDVIEDAPDPPPSSPHVPGVPAAVHTHIAGVVASTT